MQSLHKQLLDEEPTADMKLIWDSGAKHWVAIIRWSPRGVAQNFTRIVTIDSTAEFGVYAAQAILNAVQREMESWLF